MTVPQHDELGVAGGAIRARLGGGLRQNGMVLALLAIVLFFVVVVRSTQGIDFLSAQNITNLFLQNSYVIVMALGMLLVIVSGHIDLSVGSTLGFSAVIAGFLLQGVPINVFGVTLFPSVPVVVLLSCGVGAAVGMGVLAILGGRIPAARVSFLGLAGLGVGCAVLAASVFHFGELTIGQVKDSLRREGIHVR